MPHHKRALDTPSVHSVWAGSQYHEARAMQGVKHVRERWNRLGLHSNISCTALCHIVNQPLLSVC